MALSFSLTSQDVEKVRTPLLAVPVFKGRKLGRGAEAVGKASEGSLRDFMKEAGFEGRVGETLAVPSGRSVTADAVLLVGVGEQRDLTADGLRRAAAAVARRARSVSEVTVTLLDAVGGSSGSDAVGDADAAQAVAEGFLLGGYQFLKHKGAGSRDGAAGSPSKLRRVKLHGEGTSVRRGMEHGQAVAEGVTIARDLVNGPAASVTPAEMARVARNLKGVRTTVWDQSRAKREGLGGLLGVAAGSETPPRLIRMTYTPERPRATVVLVGKGITFDSGGLSLKPTGFIENMKYDMAGGAAVIGAMSVLPALRPPVKVIGIVCATENMPSGTATKLGDVLTIRNGKTVEVLNTDAEGRLVLADGLSLAAEEQPDAVFDLATLTGACAVALGNGYAALMSNNEDAAELVEAASERTGERVWRLPLPGDYRSQLDSEVGDIKNVGGGRFGGAITAGLFLQEFVDEVPWAHVDIASTAWRDNGPNGYETKGATGYGVRLLSELLLGFRKPKRSRPART